MATAFVFPGQGSQTSDMRAQVAERRPDLLALAEEIAGCDPFARVEESTRFAQPAIYCASLAALAGCDEPAPDAAVGHSMGEIAALVAAGALSETDGLRLIFHRGEAMAAASDRRRRSGSMMAALGGELETVRDLAERCTLTIANDNCPGQVVLSGARSALVVVADRLQALGVRTAMLNVAGAFHSTFMAPAVGPFAEALAQIDFRPSQFPVWSSTQVRPFRDAADIRDSLAAALVRPVRWRETVLAMHAAGFERFVEPGPGRVLTALNKRTLRAVAAHA